MALTLKLDMLLNLLRSQPPAVMGTSETISADSIDSSELNIPGFDFFRKDRNRLDGRVAFLCNLSLNPTLIALPSDILSTKLEVLAMKIAPQNYSLLLLCVIYRPQSLPAARIRDYHSLLNWLSLRLPSVVLRDLNVDLLTNPDFATEILTCFNISKHIIWPMRITAHSKTLLDHIYSSDRDMISNEGEVELHLSDQKAAFCFLNRIRSYTNSHY